MLSNNKLVGAFPATIFNMSRLRFLLVFKNNSLSGTLPSSTDFSLPNLEELLLSNNNFSGTIPRFIFNASKLSGLDLSRNSSDDFIPDTFGYLRNLKRLSLYNNYLSSTPELSFLYSLSNCKYLELITLSKNPLNCILPRSIVNLSHYLETFSMLDCNISGGMPDEISNLTNLIGIEISGNKLNGSIPVTLGN